MRLNVDGTRRARGQRLAGPAFRVGPVCLALVAALPAPAEAQRLPRPMGWFIPGTRVDTVHAEAGRPTILSVQPDLLSRLQVLADGLRKEIVLCLHGEVIGDTARVTRFTMPDPRHSDTGSARFGPCPPGALAAWHNHPVPPPGFRVPQAVTAEVAAGLCRLSDTDVRTVARAGHPFTVVSVDASTLCWWTLQEVRGLERRERRDQRRRRVGHRASARSADLDETPGAFAQECHGGTPGASL